MALQKIGTVCRRPRLASWVTAALPSLQEVRRPGDDSTSKTWTFSQQIFAVGVASAAAAFTALSQKPTYCYYKELPDGSTDRLSRWTKRSWASPRGKNPVFHDKAVSKVLERHVNRIRPTPGANIQSAPSIVVPCCGKSVDLPYLCVQGFGVLGVEGARRAILEFHEEQRQHIRGLKDRVVLSRGPNELWREGEHLCETAESFQGHRAGRTFKMSSEGLGYHADFPAIWRGQYRDTLPSSKRPIHIIEGDMFEVTSDLVATATFERSGRFDAAFDRGGLDIIPPSTRQDYVAVLDRLLKPGGRLLLVVLDYDEDKLPDSQGRRGTPPPYGVPEAEIHRLFPAEAGWTVELLERQQEHRLSRRILPLRDVDLHEAAYLITKSTNAKSPGSLTEQSSGEVGFIATPLLVVLATALLGVGAAAALVSRMKDV